jgi:hypothetical protein
MTRDDDSTVLPDEARPVSAVLGDDYKSHVRDSWILLTVGLFIAGASAFFEDAKFWIVVVIGTSFIMFGVGCLIVARRRRTSRLLRRLF